MSVVVLMWAAARDPGLDAAILIVGAGPAGTAVALELLSRGVDPDDILMIDRNVFPREKLCAGAVTWRGCQWLEQMTGTLPEQGATTDRICLGFGEFGGGQIQEEGPQRVYSRKILDFYLLNKVLSLGVRCEQDVEVREVLATHCGWRVRSARGCLSARWLIAADGAMSTVRRLARLGDTARARLVEGVFESSSGELSRRELYFDFEPLLHNIRGYAWIFPDPASDRRWKIGVMDAFDCIDGRVLRDFVRRFAERRGFGRSLGRIRGWQAPYFHRHTKAHIPGLVTVGDAWGVDPLWAEGIAPSFAMARYAASRLKAALDRSAIIIGNFERDFARTSEGRNLLMHKMLASAVYGDKGADWARMLVAAMRSGGSETRRRGSRQVKQGAALSLQLLRRPALWPGSVRAIYDAFR